MSMSLGWVMRCRKKPSPASTFDREPPEFTQSCWILESSPEEEEFLYGGAPWCLGAILLAVIKCYLAK